MEELGQHAEAMALANGQARLVPSWDIGGPAVIASDTLQETQNRHVLLFGHTSLKNLPSVESRSPWLAGLDAEAYFLQLMGFYHPTSKLVCGRQVWQHKRTLTHFFTEAISLFFLDEATVTSDPYFRGSKLDDNDGTPGSVWAIGFSRELEQAAGEPETLMYNQESARHVVVHMFSDAQTPEELTGTWLATVPRESNPHPSSPRIWVPLPEIQLQVGGGAAAGAATGPAL